MILQAEYFGVGRYCRHFYQELTKCEDLKPSESDEV